jgi:hypothetical protein
MIRAIGVVLVFCVFLVSCTEKVICPAYQSAYIYDKEALRKKFSYFKEDSTPKIYTASKNKYLIAEPTTYKKKNRSLQTIVMKAIQPVVPDSLKEDGMNAEMNVDSVQRNVYDSTAVIRIDTLGAADSVYMISKDKEVRVLKYNPIQRKYYVDTIGFNTEQDNYMWYLKDILVLPDVKLVREKEEAGKKEAANDKKQKKGIRGFFNKLFKKKDKSKLDQDSTQNLKNDQEDYGYDDFEGKPKDTTNIAQPTEKPAPKKKGIFSFLKKDKKEPKKKEPDSAKKEDEKDDGF